jgi:hypothetical protein
MKTRLDGLRLTILAALGLELACAGRPGGVGGDSTGSSGSGDSGTADTGDSGDSEGTADTGETRPPPPAYECADPTPIFQAGTDVPSGFVTCEDGFIHRAEKVDCLAPQGEDSPICTEGDIGTCQTSADCLDGVHGSCIDDPWGGCLCHYGCVNDDDCDNGYVCACAGVMSDRATCIPADCTVDDDCDNGLCGLSEFQGCCENSYKLACADEDAPCHTDADCGEDLCDPNWPEGGTVMHHCSAESELNPDKKEWSCEPPGWCGCDCGRPFFVDGEARTAPAVARDDWTRARQPRVVDELTRRRLAAYWTEIGRFEHASVASFARFCLQLMHLGAPPELLAENQRAMADEIEHARLAFGLASAYASAPVGPGPLDVDTSLEHTLDRRAIVEGLVVEACVGETLAAIEAQEAAQWAADPVVAATLSQIAADELRHARLGWRSLRWILEHADASTRTFALEVLEAAVRAVAVTPAQGFPIGLRRHGVLDDRLRHEVRAKALESLVIPCLAGLRERFGSAHVGAQA